MAGPKRKSQVLESSSSAVADDDTDIVDNVHLGQESDDDSDSSVYSELEGKYSMVARGTLRVSQGFPLFNLLLLSLSPADDDEESASEGDESESDQDEEEVGDEEEEEDDDSKEEESEEDDEKPEEPQDKDLHKKPKGKDNSVKKGKDQLEESSPGDKETSAKEKNEYEYDSSDEEDIRNTIGNIPVNWYDDYEHIGYDLDGKRIRKPKRGDELDHFLRRMEDGDAGITVRDPMTGQDVVLSQKRVEEIRRLRGSKVPDASYNLYADLVPWFSSEVMETPVRDLPESKRSFLPSLDEKRKVGKMVHSIKMGWMKTKAEREKEKEEDPEKRYYMLWKTDNEAEDGVRRINDLIPAPKMKLPDHAESYNPPPEYLFTEQEKKRWEELGEEEPYKRKLQFIPAKHDSLRKVPAYREFIKERFERCMDLYLAPRARKMRLTIQPEDLLPQLPNPKDLQPFPTACALTYKGHANMVRTISIDPTGQFIASGSDDGTVKVWEIQTGYCMKTFEFKKVAIKSVMWCPNKALCVLAVALESMVVLLNGSVGDKVITGQTDELLGQPPEMGDYTAPDRVRSAVTWGVAEKSDGLPKESLVVLKFFRQVKQVTWHAKGDYFATTLSDAQNRSVLIHQLSKWRSQVPFSKSKGMVQCVLFHPIRPYLFVATQRHVRIYNLSKQDLAKKLQTGAKWISSLAIHPKGDNVLISTYDKKVQWFDLDLSTLPYQVLRYHHSAVRQVAYHRRYPLFASCSDDTSIIVSHGMVYSDLLQNPLIVPVKHLRGHTKYDDFGVMDVAWHPTQPWLFSAGADGYIKLWT